jgi:hypothetical protein
MRKHKSFSVSVPLGLADEIDAYCAKTEISKSRYVVRLLKASLSQVEA